MNTAPTPSIRVLHVVSGDLYAGAERIVEELAIAQHAHLQMQVSAAVLNEGRLAENLRQAGVNTHLLDERRMGAAAVLFALRRLVSASRVQVVHTHRFKENVLGALASVGRVPSLRTVHGAPEFSRSRGMRDRVIEALDRFTATRLQSRIVCVSEELRERLRTVYPGQTLTCVVNGIDGARVRAAASIQVPALAGEIRVGVFARLVPVKRVELAIDVVSRVRARLGTDVVLHVFGDGPLEASLRGQAEGRAGVTFHGNTQQAPAFMRQMHALLMTSSHEGLPVAVLEAMALSVPVVATRTGGIPQVLAEGECGWLAEAQDADGYVHSLAEAVSFTERRAAKIAGALDRAEREFSARRMAEDYLGLYGAVLSPHARAAGAQLA
jgi:glycosyltransferase involved in cell wall biosynthesis